MEETGSVRPATRWPTQAIATVALLLAACDAEDSVVELGMIDYVSVPPMIEAPALVAVGEEFVLRVMTYGDSCISFERTDVDLTGDGADILPFDRRHVIRGNEVCALILQSFPHDATLAFDTAGTKTIHIHGRRQRARVVDTIIVPVAIVVE